MRLEDGFPPFPDFLTIYHSNEHSQLLVIPRRSYKDYPKPLPHTAVLKRPEGNFWTVKWIISTEETISFQDGWQRFVKDNGLIDRDFILFTYDGSRSFWVRIHRNGLPLKMKSPIKIQEISDDEDVTIGDDDHRMKEEDNHDNMIISLSLGSSDDVSHDDDYDNTAISEVNNTRGSSKKGRFVRMNHADAQQYLDNPQNPFFTTTSSSSSRPVLVIANQVVTDYDLKFDRTINLIDEFGEIKRKIGKWKDRVVVNKWHEVYKRNKAKPGDAIICEIIRKEEVVRSIKVHFVKR